MRNCSFLYRHNSIPGIGTDLVASNAFLADLVNDLPIRMAGCVLPTGFSLHRDIVMVNLADRGNTVQANDFLHSVERRYQLWSLQRDNCTEVCCTVCCRGGESNPED